MSSVWESALVEALGAVLNQTDIAPDTSIFAAGGTSLHAEIFARAAAMATGQTVTFTDVFQHPTPAGLAKALATRDSAAPAPEAPRRSPTDWHPVSENQAARLERLRVSETTGVRLFRSDSELIVFGLDMAGKVDVPRLQGAVDAVITGNGALRTAFEWRDEEFRQRVRPQSFGLELLDAGRLHPTEIVDAVWRPFRLDSGQLARFVLATITENHAQLWIAIDHIVSDAVTCAQIQRQLAEHYSTGQHQEPRDIEGFEFAYLEKSWCEGDQGRAAEQHWLDLIGDGPVWREFAHPGIVATDGTDDVLLLRRLDRDVGAALRERAAALGSTLHALVVFALVRAAARVSGCPDVSVYWYTANRNLPDVETTVGSLAGITMARIKDVPSGRSESEVRVVTDTVAATMAYAFYPIDRIARQHRPDDWLMPDDRPLLVLHVNEERRNTGPDKRHEYAGLQVTAASLCGRRDRRGFTIDASTRFTDDAFTVGLSCLDGMIGTPAVAEMLDVFAEELVAVAGAQ